MANAPFLKELGYLYFAFAHLTDKELSEAEIEKITDKLHARDAEMGTDDLNALIEEIEQWYNATNENRLDVVYAIAQAIHERFADEQFKRTIIKDLIAIAEADKEFKDEEREFIKVLSRAWDVEL